MKQSLPWRVVSYAAIVGVSTFALVTSSCSRGTKPAETAPSDTHFVVDGPVELLESKQKSTLSDWSIPTQNQMTFRACLKDADRSEEISNESFAIYSDKNRQDVQTDAHGCMSWSETIAFDPSLPETILSSTRSIEGLGTHKGVREISLALDPWQTAGNLALAESNTENAQSLSEPKPRLHLDSVQIRPSAEANENQAYSAQFRFAPHWLRTSLKGNEVQELIDRGQFEVTLTLIDQRNALAEKTLSARAENGIVQLDVSIPTQKRFPPNSALELFMRISPVHAPFAIAPEEGIIRLGSVQFEGSAAFQHLDEPLESYLSPAQAQDSASASCTASPSQNGFYIQSLSVENLGTTRHTDNEKVPNQILASYNVCLAISANRGQVADQSFEVQLTDPSGRAAAPQMVQSTNGCLSFTDLVNFEYFSAEDWQKKTLRITAREGLFQGITREFPITLDPWATDAGFFWDCRRGQRPEFNTAPARLELLDFSYQFTGRELEINSQLDLTLKRHYEIQITPRLKRSAGFDGLPKYETLSDGRYRFRIILLAPNEDQNLSQISGMSTEEVLKNFKYLSSYESEINTRDGRIVEDVVLPVQFADTPILSSRSAIIVQLAPLAMDESSKLVSLPFYATFSPLVDSGASALLNRVNRADAAASSNVAREKLSASRLDLAKLIEFGKQSRERQNPAGSSADALASFFKIKRPSDAELEAAGFNPVTIHSLFSSSKLSIENAKRLCTLLNANMSSKSKSACAKSPVSALQLVRTQHIEALSSQPVILDSNYSSLNVSASLNVSQAESASESTGQNDSKNSDWHASVNASAGAGFSLFGWLHGGVEASGGKGWSNSQTWYSSRALTKSRDGSAAASVSHSRSFAVEQLTFGFKAGTRQCVTFRLKKTHSPGTMICEPDAKNVRDLTESFYLLTEQNSANSSALRDAHTRKEAPWMKAIRGKKAFESLQSLLTDRSKSLVLSPESVQSQSLDRMDDVLDQFARTRPRLSDGAFPAMIY
jgi:hypothetical protein